MQVLVLKIFNSFLKLTKSSALSLPFMQQCMRRTMFLLFLPDFAVWNDFFFFFFFKEFRIPGIHMGPLTVFFLVALHLKGHFTVLVSCFLVNSAFPALSKHLKRESLRYSELLHKAFQ